MTFPALRSALLASIALVPAPLMAQEVAAADQPASSTTIIVTSQKIEQRAQDVPITISAVTGDRIEELGVSDLDELSNYVPGLNIQEQSANNPGIVIRGITSDSGSSQQGPRVTLYYNGVDISRSRGSYQAIYDLERVEVIKGPQATLFGTASAVGAISLVSARPRAGFSGEITGGYGNFDQTLLGGYLNAGSDVLAGRIAFEWRQRDGYVENLNPGQDEELYAQDQFGVRASLRYTPSMDLTIDLIGTYDQQRNGGTPFISGTLPAFAGAPGGPGNAFEDANLGGYPAGAASLGDDQLGLDREVYDLNLTAAYEFGDNWTFTTVNGYREFDSAEVFDADGSAAPFLEFAEIAQGHQFSHEGRFSYAGSALRASFGWNFFTEDGLQNVPFATEEGTFLQCLTSLFGAPLIAGIPCVAPDGSVPATGVTALATNGAANAIPYASVFENQGRNEAYSVFADVTWLATDSLELTAGARLLEENRKSAYRSNVPDAVLSGAPLIPGQIDTGGRLFSAEDSFSALLPRFNALYRISNDANVFATVSKGRRSPVVQMGARVDDAGNVVPNRQDIPEETVWNYEAGLKLATGRVSGSLGVYYQVYDNFQVSVEELDANGNPTGSFVTRSAGAASNLGVEAEIAVEATDWLSFFGNVGYIDGGIDEDNSFAPEFSGARFRLQPEWQAAAGFTVDYSLGGGARLFATPSITHRSRIYFEVPNNELTSQGPVTLVNARAGVSFAGDRYEIAGFIRNAFNEDYLLDAGNTGGAFGIPTFIPAEPRFFGVQLTASFGD
ncbi:TonB-dependent receptor [Erythrobacter citreus]|uniref:Outer membrane receptor protein involved in Fe transport n=1 Tax=Qipengyuania citrea TaxID=225971 RepID=A0A6I4U7P5_9SPHN|nr:TonB-dependent receptor [Qipengyuania citrea]MDQ0566779.1 outer membrane receptor protein involved in Fe transport [Qipengyuania citrea]MXP35131.1 TonB-dependent receptor [Qipengyuania citrea]